MTHYIEDRVHEEEAPALALDKRSEFRSDLEVKYPYRTPRKKLEEITEEEIKNLAQEIAEQVRKIGFCSANQFAELLGIDRKIIWGWITRRRIRQADRRGVIDERPSLPFFLKGRKRFVGPPESIFDWLMNFGRGTLALVALRRKSLPNALRYGKRSVGELRHENHKLAKTEAESRDRRL